MRSILITGIAVFLFFGAGSIAQASPPTVESFVRALREQGFEVKEYGNRSNPRLELTKLTTEKGLIFDTKLKLECILQYLEVGGSVVYFPGRQDCVEFRVNSLSDEWQIQFDPKSGQLLVRNEFHQRFVRAIPKVLAP